MKAIKNNQLTTWPGLTAEAVDNYLPDHAQATYKGHMRRKRKGVRSTKVKEALETIEHNKGMNPPVKKEKMNQLFCYVGILYKKDGTIMLITQEISPSQASMELKPTFSSYMIGQVMQFWQHQLKWRKMKR